MHRVYGRDRNGDRDRDKHTTLEMWGKESVIEMEMEIEMQIEIKIEMEME